MNIAYELFANPKKVRKVRQEQRQTEKFKVCGKKYSNRKFFILLFIIILSYYAYLQYKANEKLIPDTDTEF